MRGGQSRQEVERRPGGPLPTQLSCHLLHAICFWLLTACPTANPRPNNATGGGGVCSLPAQAVPGVRSQPDAAEQEAAALPLLPPPRGGLPACVDHGSDPAPPPRGRQWLLLAAAPAWQGAVSERPARLAPAGPGPVRSRCCGSDAQGTPLSTLLLLLTSVLLHSLPQP